MQADPLVVPQILAPSLTVLRDRDSDVQEAALKVLGAVAQADPLVAPQILAPSLTALRDENWRVHSAARELLGAFALNQLIDAYWATHDQSLIPFITPQLLYTPLVVVENKPGHRTFTLYPAAGEVISWEKPKAEAAPLVKLLQSNAKLNYFYLTDLF